MENVKIKLAKGIFIAILFVGLAACDKDEFSSLQKIDPASATEGSAQNFYSLEHPLSTFIQTSGKANVTQGNGWTYDWRGGYKFRSLIDGSVNKLGIRVPGTGTYYIDLWDAATRQRIAKVTWFNSIPGKLTYVALPQWVSIFAGHQYVITVTLQSENSYYTFSKNSTVSGNLMPFYSGNIIIEHGCWRSIIHGLPPDNYSDYNQYPGNSNISYNHIYGYPDIEFVWVGL